MIRELTKRLTAEEIFSFLAERRKHCPSLRLIPAGKSRCGQEIPAAGLGCLKHPVLFAGGFSPSDRMSVLLLLRLLEVLSAPEDSPLSGALERRGVLLCPMMDPDGFTAAASGRPPAEAGLRRSFQAGVPFPETEPEAKALVRLCSVFAPRRVFEVVSCGEAILSACPKVSPSSSVCGELLAASCGYRLVTGKDAAEPGSFKDRFAAAGGEGYTIRAGRCSPVPDEDLESLFTRLLQTFLLGVVL